jgi:Phosphotransferase enzyme family
MIQGSDLDSEPFTPQAVASFLLERGLVQRQCFVEGDLTVEDVSRRNVAYKVVSEAGPSYLVKQGLGSDGVAGIANEASIYRYFQSYAYTDDFLTHLPRLYLYDSAKSVLVFELVADAQTVADYHVLRRRFPTALAETSGRLLADLHATPLPTRKSAVGKYLDPPWVLAIHRPYMTIFRDNSGAIVESIRVLQQFPDLGSLLDGLQDGWKPDAILHFDLKWDNCLLARKPTGSWRHRLRLVDWEFAGIGDPRWDVGSMLSEYLSFWVFWLPIASDTPPEQFVALTRYPLDLMQPAACAFWNAYKHRSRMDPGEAREFLSVAVRYAAARLIQTAIESLQDASEITSNAPFLFQLSFNILKRPAEAASRLLGIPVRDLADFT